MSTTASTPLFACSRCFSRHPFEELSTGEQLCKVRTSQNIKEYDVDRIIICHIYSCFVLETEITVVRHTLRLF